MYLCGVSLRVPLERRDKLLLASLLFIWLVLISLNTHAVLRGIAYPPLTVAPASEPGGYPTVGEILFPWLGAGDSGLQVGDRLVTFSRADLRGVGPFGFLVLVPEEAGTRRTARVVFERNGSRHQTTIALGSFRELWPCLPASLAFAATAVLLIVRVRPTDRIRPVFVTMMLGAIYLVTNFAAERSELTYVLMVVHIAALSLLFPMAFHAMHVVAGDGHPTGRLARAVACGLVAGGPLYLALLLGLPHARTVLFCFGVAALGSVLLFVTSGYRRADPILRRQARWVIYGLYCAFVPTILTIAAAAIDPRVLPWLFYTRLATIAIPISILIAIARYDLFDIDRLFSTTVSYNIVLVAIVGSGLVLVPAISSQAAAIFRIEPWIGQVLFSLLAATVVVPLHQRLRPRLERRFFPERHAIDNGIAQLLIDLDEPTTARALLVYCAQGLQRLLALESCAAYLRLDATYERVFADGLARPSTFDQDGVLISALRAQRGPLALGQVTERPDSELDPFGRAALESLQANVLVPIRHDDELVGFLCLGEKGSGDVYTTTDLRLLADVVANVAGRLEQFDHARRTAAPPILLPRKFEIIGKLGQGGMGTVFRARHVTLDTIVAIKILLEPLASDPEFVSRFEREARVMAELRHPNIVRVLDIDSEHSVHYLVMEYIAGRTVGDLVREEGPLSLDRILGIAIPVAEALEFAHAHDPPVVHRDVSPSNILVEDGTGRVVVTDFGIAKVSEAKALTRTGDFLGKARYAPPEQLRGDGDLDGRADLYALGMVIYEMLAGRAFFAGCDDREILHRVVYEQSELVPELPDTVPMQVVTIVARAIARDRARRYQSAADLLRDLRSVREPDGSASASASEVTPIAFDGRQTDDEPAAHLAATVKIPPR